MKSIPLLLSGALAIGLAGSCGTERSALPPASSPAARGPATRATATKELRGELPPLAVVLDEPRFAAARARVQAKDMPGAARAFDEARAQTPAQTDSLRQAALDYVAGKLHRDAGDDAGAALAFDRVPEGSPLGPYASLHAAEACARLGRADDAIARAQRVPEDAVVAPEARLTVAEVLAARGDRAEALPIWRAHLEASPHGVRWVDTCVKVATAILDGVEGDPGARAREAFDLASRVVVEAPKLAEASGGRAARDRATALLRAADPKFDDALSPADRARRAQAWLDANEPAKALAEVALLPLPAPGAATPPAGPDACRLAMVRAQATAKLRQPAADAYGDAIARCAGDDALPSALFSGAKASLAAKRSDEGLARYAQLEQLFPGHRLADDARLRAAIALQQSGDDARAEAMLAALADDFPEGDMRGEALARLAIARVARGDWEGAKAPLDRAAAIEEGELKAVNAGRAAYFRARASAMTGDTADAAARYEQIIARRPLSFVMLEAYARLAEVDAARARQVMEGALAREQQAAPAALLTRDHPVLHAPAFARGVGLLEVGEIDDARRELSRALSVDPPGAPVDPEVVWATALLYEEAGAPDVAQGLVGARLGEHLAHYPVGRWKTCWEIAYPRPFADLVQRASAASSIPPVLTWAVMRQESAFIPDVRSPSDAYGLMQLLVRTARGLARGTAFEADAESLKRPEVNITLGAKYLADLRANYPTNRALAIAAYNGGGGSVSRWLAARPNDDFDLWIEEIPFEETRGYMKRVLANEAAYAFLYAPDALGDVLAFPAKVTR